MTDSRIIRERIRSGAIRAIALDTSIFSANAYKLNSGVLGQLKQFSADSITILVPDIVKREVLDHIQEKISSCVNLTRKAFRGVEHFWPELSSVEAAFNLASSSAAGDIAAQRFADFESQSCVVVLDSADYARIDEVVDGYFRGAPPFSAGKKKSEFPDAIALSTINSWCLGNRVEVLLVSTDSDWRSYSDVHDRMYVLEDLAEVLSLFQLDSADEMALQLSRRFEEGLFGDAEAFVGDAIRDELAAISFSPDASSDFLFDHFRTVTDVQKTELVPVDGKSLFRPLSQDNGLLVVEAMAIVDIDFTFYFDFFVRDSVDRDEVPLGPGIKDVAMSAFFNVVITFAGHPSVAHGEVVVEESEATLVTSRVVPCGTIEPEFAV